MLHGEVKLIMCTLRNYYVLHGEVKANYVQFAERNVPSPYRSTCLPGSGEKGTQIT